MDPDEVRSLQKAASTRERKRPQQASRREHVLRCLPDEEMATLADGTSEDRFFGRSAANSAEGVNTNAEAPTVAD